jgi:hypothetical protein
MDWESVDHPTLHRLWKLAVTTLREIRAMARRGSLPGGDRQLARAAQWPAHSVFDPIGLLFVRPLEQYGYDATPTNSLAFAATGGDGVHFSFMLQDDRPAAEWPVVMTVPCGFGSIILGANLDDFLGLGMFRGYFCLEQLIYQPEKYVEAYSAREPWPEDEEGVRWLRQRFAERLDLRPWDDVRGRLNRLQREFSPLLTWEDGPSGDNNWNF